MKKLWPRYWSSPPLPSGGRRGTTRRHQGRRSSRAARKRHRRTNTTAMMPCSIGSWDRRPCLSVMRAARDLSVPGIGCAVSWIDVEVVAIIGRGAGAVPGQHLVYGGGAKWSGARRWGGCFLNHFGRPTSGLGRRMCTIGELLSIGFLLCMNRVSRTNPTLHASPLRPKPAPDAEFIRP